MSALPKLSSAALEVAEFYALVYPARPSKTQGLRCVNAARSRAGEQQLTNAGVNVALQAAVESGVLSATISERGNATIGPQARRGHIAALCISAVAAGRAAAMFEAFLGPHYRPTQVHMDDDPRLEALHRFAVVSGQPDRSPPTAPAPATWHWLAEPAAAALLPALPDALREAAVAGCLEQLIWQLEPIEPFATAAAEQFGAAAVAPWRALARCLSGEFAAATAVFEALPAAQRSRKPVAVAECATAALLAFMRGDDTLAAEAIEQCLRAERQGTRKRKVYPDSTAFSLALLALPRGGDGEALQRFEALVEGQPGPAARWASLHLAARLATRGRGQALAPLALARQDLCTAWLAIASNWNEHIQVSDSALQSGAFAALVAAAERGGYTPLAIELRGLQEAVGGGSRAAQDEQIAALGMRSLARWREPVPAWEQTLQRLESLAPRRAEPAAPAGEVAGKRLAWRLIEYRYGVDLEPLLQSAGASGRWSAGRKVALRRLATEPDSIEGVSERDRRAGQALERHEEPGYYGGTVEYRVGGASLCALAGHPLVFDAGGHSVDIVQHEPVLSVSTDEAGNYRLRIEPAVCEGERFDIVWDSVARRLSVTRFATIHYRLDRVLGGETVLPAAQRERLEALLAGLAREVQVVGEGLVDAADAVAGDPRTRVLIEAGEESLTLRLCVQPLADSDSRFDVGEGGEVVYVSREGRQLAVRRDLAAERAAMQALLDRLPALSAHYNGRPRLRVMGLAPVLALLEELGEAPDLDCRWPERMPVRVTHRAATEQLRLRIKSAEQWFTASGELELGDGNHLSLERLHALIDAHPGERFVPVGEGEFLALSAELREQLEGLGRSSSAAPGGARRLHPLAALALEPLLETAAVRADKRWRERSARWREAFVRERAPPSTLAAELRPYQLAGFRWLSRLGEIGAGACLADDMGLGKTVQILAALLARARGGPALVVVPTSVLGNWQSECRRFAPTLQPLLYGGSAGAREEAVAALGPFSVLITSYGLLHHDIERFAAQHWHTLVLDEAQAIKNAATQRAKAVRRLQAAFRIAASGTPVQNHLGDLHALFQVLIPGLLGSAAQFRRQFLLPIERDGNAAAREQLQRLIAPFLLRRLKGEVLDDLPARTEITLEVQLGAAEAALYESSREQALAALSEAREAGADELGEGQKKMQVLAQLTRLRRLCCNPALVVPDWRGGCAKLALFQSTLDELLANRHKVLVFSQFVDHLKLVEEALRERGISYQYLDGSTPARQRSERVAAFQDGEGEVFLISLTAGGTGLNLTAADYVIHLDPWWNPAVEDQATDRAHRIGQQRPVTVYRMVCAGTVEEQIQVLHKRKRELADALLAGGGAARLQLDELMALLGTVAER